MESDRKVRLWQDVGQYTREVAVDELPEQSPKIGWNHDNDFNKCANKN